TVANNVVRRAKGGGTLPQTNGVGIGAEGDVVVIGNVVEDTRDTGISLGWGRYSRTLTATGNIVRNTPRGIVFSMSEGADEVLIANNRISGVQQAIIGADHGTPVTDDLGKPGAEIPAGSVISANLVS
ncbi:MAG: right-handed parallel beta-helix repeat-containing protein, partial [Alphaproteobacteria bacterium]|nr:right-handed parallel beta-helix repeat-containing protein [Alphaproteobacteria bacterium]